MIAERVKCLQHLGVPTKDMEATLKFYKAIGFKVDYETRNEGNRVVFMSLAGLSVEAYESGEVAGKPGAIDHIALDVDDVDLAHKEVTEAGFTPIEPAIRFLPFFDKGVRFFNIMGPNGEKVEFNQIL